MARSGIQRQVLDLYKQFLIATASKPIAYQPKLRRYIASEFRKKAQSIGKRDIDTIEWYLRKGEKQLQAFKDPNLTDIQV
jgi:succinate dehydrogenase assembly factor 1